MWMINSFLWLLLCFDPYQAQQMIASGAPLYVKAPANWDHASPFTPTATSATVPHGQWIGEGHSIGRGR